jgi:adenosylhomocysteine nucleosidase
MPVHLEPAARVDLMVSILVVAPQMEEAAALLRRFRERGLLAHDRQVGRLRCTLLPALDMLVAVGGNGKAQFGLQAQHLIVLGPDASLLFCVGAAGRLAESVSVGDVVVATSTIEHDYTERFISESLPCCEGHAEALSQLMRAVAAHDLPFRVHFGPIASGDEDIVDADRSAEILTATQALCVAWEGMGGARAARFSEIGFVEIRAITDGADANAAQSFHEHLDHVLPHIADLLMAWHSQV